MQIAVTADVETGRLSVQTLSLVVKNGCNIVIGITGFQKSIVVNRHARLQVPRMMQRWKRFAPNACESGLEVRSLLYFYHVLRNVIYSMTTYLTRRISIFS
jgi:hypothetical protein